MVSWNHGDGKGSSIKSLKETGGLSGFAGTVTESFLTTDLKLMNFINYKYCLKQQKKMEKLSEFVLTPVMSSPE